MSGSCRCQSSNQSSPYPHPQSHSPAFPTWVKSLIKSHSWINNATCNYSSVLSIFLKYLILFLLFKILPLYVIIKIEAKVNIFLHLHLYVFNTGNLFYSKQFIIIKGIYLKSLFKGPLYCSMGDKCSNFPFDFPHYYRDIK